MQNCDLPPPSKVFKGLDNILIRPEYSGEGNGDVFEVLKALRSSQTRAREAEKKCESLTRERDFLSNGLMKEAMRLYGYKQQVRLLELQVFNLQGKGIFGFSTSEDDEGSYKEDEDDYGEERVSLLWILALALSWGIGVSTAIACSKCRYFL